MFNYLLFQGLLVAILYCFVNKEVRQMCFHVAHHFNLISAIAAVPSSPFIEMINQTFLIMSVPIASLYQPFYIFRSSALFMFCLILLSTKWDGQDIVYLLISKLLNVVFGKSSPSDEVHSVWFYLHYTAPCTLSLSLILWHPVFSQVQSEMLKKWKRWKLGKDIDEEYRHTHSHTPHIKSGSIATGNLPYLNENNASEPSGDSPRLSKAHQGPQCSTAPEENRRLVVSYSNGTGNKSRSTKSRHSRQFSILPHRGAGHVSTATEEMCLEERAQCCSCPLEGEETSVWRPAALSRHHKNSTCQCSSYVNDRRWRRKWPTQIRMFTAT